ATAALSAAAVAPIAGGDPAAYGRLTVLLAVVTGLVCLVAGATRLGFLANFISAPVLKGFIIGLALTIIVGQLPKLFGVTKGSGTALPQLWHVITELGATSVTTLATGLAAFVAMLALRRWLPLVPASLVVVVLAVVAVAIWHLDQHGVAVVGPITAGLPRFGLPSGTTAADYLELAGPAIGVMVVGFAEGLAAARTYAEQEGYPIAPDRELFAVGAANLGAGLCSGMVVNGSLSKTAVNGSAGARSQLSGLTTAALTVLTLLFLTSLFELLPDAVLAAIVIAAVVDLVDVPALRRLYQVWTARIGRIYGVAAREDFIAAVVALAGVVLFGTLPGLLIGVGASLALLTYRSSRPHVAVLGLLGASWVDTSAHPDAVTEPGITVARVEGSLFFANADYVCGRLRDLAGAGIHALVLDARTIATIDLTAATALTRLAAQLHRRGVRVYLARDVGQVRDVIEHSGSEIETGRAGIERGGTGIERGSSDLVMFRRLEDALAAARR
ncbi:MAG TPA: SulP family inorganic anion transporter, partial [Micromonosporaceae bacterium]